MTAFEVSSYWLDYIVKGGGEAFMLESELALARKGIWIMAGVCSAIVGLSGILPAILIAPKDFSGNSKSVEGSDEGDRKAPLNFLLSFAVGSLLGDVFLHLLPEACMRLHEEAKRNPTLTKEEIVDGLYEGYFSVGLWIVIGLLTFVFVELAFNVDGGGGGGGKGNKISVSGYLNLVANCVDNFSHGLAVGGACLVSTKVGLVTTVCILLHEIPHEVGDFAILIKSGFSRYEAVKAQLSTALLGIVGAFFALALDSLVAVDSVTYWIIPFTCGGFLNIALVTVLPDLLEPKSVGECFKTALGISLGILAMMSVSRL